MKIFDLNGRIAIVSGAGGQLGGEYVGALLEAGARVVAADINKLNLPVADEMKDRLLQLPMDITSRSDMENVLESVRSKWGEPSILVNNAAIDAPPGAGEQETGPFEDYPESSWDQMMDVNLKGMFLSCQVFGAQMAKGNGGSIINIASIYGILSPDQRIYEYREEKTGKPFYKPITYCVAKSGVLNMTRYLATYWAKQNVRVNSLTLGGVFNNQDEDFLSGYNNKVPLGRMARADEYNGAIVFMASDASSYMTGSNMVIDGGFSSW